MEITSLTMEMAWIWPVSLQFSTQECGNCERQFLRNSGQLAKMIFAIFAIYIYLFINAHILYHIVSWYDTYDTKINLLYHSWINIYIWFYIFTSASWCSKWLTYTVGVCWESLIARMFSKSKRFGDNFHGASGPGPTTYKIKRLFDDGSAQQPKRVRKPQALPMLLGKKPPCNDPSKVESKNAPADSNVWSDVFACNGYLAKGATGMVFSGTLKAQGARVALKRILDPKLWVQDAFEFQGH